MRRLVALLALLPVFSPAIGPAAEAGEDSPFALVIHGGAGTIRRADVTPEKEAEYTERLTAALAAGHELLGANGSALDAVEAVIRLLEDSPLFNAGKGAVFTAARRNELDASIMDGAALEAGAVAGVTTVRNPISAARAVMERTPHVLLSGPGAEAFAAEAGLEIVDPSYFATERRLRALERAQERETEESARASGEPDRYLGTVGAVALDRQGRIAAGTSTGGMTNKRHGRIGDSPIIGAGTYANAECGVSATGHGEYFIRHAVAFDICARATYEGRTAGEAAHHVIHEVLAPRGGSGGVITLDRQGRHAAAFNTDGMYRGWIGVDGEPHVAMFAD
jgi:beta-aspartyl-peptidase (threonine type)